MPAALPSDKSVLSSEEGSPGLQVTGCLGNAAADPDCPMATCLHSTQFQLATGHPGQVSRELTLSALGWQIDEDALQGSIWEGWAHRAPSAVLSCFCLPSCVGLLAWWLEFPLAAVGSQTVGRLLGFWQPARERAAGNPAPVALPRRKPPPTKVVTRDRMGKWWPAGSDFCIPSDTAVRF